MNPKGKQLQVNEVEEASSTPASGDWLQNWFAGDYATGDWGGLRTDMEEAGVKFEGGYVTDLLALTHGGAARGGNWDYAGYMYGGLNFDLEKLANLTGTSFFIDAGWSSGNDLARKVGNLFTPAQAYTGTSVRLVRMYFQQDLLDDEVTFKIGRLATEDDFVASSIYGEYVSGGINSVPESIFYSTPGFTGWPQAQWGAVAAYQPIDGLRFAAGVYNADDEVNKNKTNGVDFSLNTDNGVMTIGEVSYGWDVGGAESKDYPGLAKLGGWYDSGPRPSLTDESQNRGDNGGFYISLQQQVYTEPGSEGERGLTPWVIFAYAPKQSVNLIPAFVGTGMVYKGLIPGRDDDSAAIGFLYGNLSSDVENASAEKVLEVAYTANLTKWFYVRPDAQFIFDPSGDSHISNAVVLGGEIGVVF